MIRLNFLPCREVIRVNRFMKSSWVIPEVDNTIVSNIALGTGIERAVVAILYSRGYRTEEDIYRFLYPELADLHSPFLMKGIYEAQTLIKKHLELKSKIAIFADSDLDGITSLTIIYDLLVKLGNTPIIRYPRNKEGYGLTCDVIQEFIDQGVDLIITVDSGIRDFEEINMASKQGIDVIITDHHEPDDVVPDAVIVNPKQKDCPYPFKELAGVGVTFKLAHALLYSYIAGFDNRFVITIKHEQGYEFSFLINGCVTHCDAVRNSNLTEYISEKINDKDFFVLFDEDPEFIKMIKSFYSDIKVKYISELYTGKDNSGTRDLSSIIDSMVKEYGINPALCKSRMDLACKVFLEMQLRSSTKIFSLLKQYLVLVSLGTIADIMPVHNENRQMIKYGISLLNRGEGHYGINSLLKDDPVNTKSISWGVAPLLNAPGRFGETDLTVKFFLENDKESIAEITTEIQKLNRKRKKIVSEIISSARESIEEHGSELYGNLYLYHNDEIIDGLAGLVANRIADDLKKPVIVTTALDDNGLIKGSGRSYGGFNFFQYVEPFAELFEKLGGHAQAFGFIIRKENLHKTIVKISESIGDKTGLDTKTLIDCVIDIDEISNSLIDKLELIEPYGKENEEPLFYSSDIEIKTFSSCGADNRHGRYILKNGISAIGWNMASEMDSFYRNKQSIEMIYKIEKNTYMNRTNPQIIIVDIN